MKERNHILIIGIVILVLVFVFLLKQINACERIKVKEYLYTTTYGNGLVWVYETDLGIFESDAILSIGEIVCI